MRHIIVLVIVGLAGCVSQEPYVKPLLNYSGTYQESPPVYPIQEKDTAANQPADMQQIWQQLSPQEQHSKSVQENMPNCPDGPVFTAAPASPQGYTDIIPLGNLEPVGHTLPTQHVYFHLVYGTQGSIATDIVAPGNVKIVSVQESTTYDANGRKIRADYRIEFMPCRELKAYYNHVAELSQDIQASLKTGNKICYDHQQSTGESDTLCSYFVDYSAKAGEYIGKSGSGVGIGAFDLGAYDSRAAPLAYANPSRYNSQADGLDEFHYACALDYFEENIKSQLYSRVQRTAPPRCGQVMQDIRGTAQGNWYKGNAAFSRPDTWDRMLALVHDNTDPATGIISVGGTIAEAGKMPFTPAHAGNVNREFSEILPGNTVYCYTSNVPKFQNNKPTIGGRILLHLSNETSLTIEHQNGGCTGSFVFVNPVRYER